MKRSTHIVTSAALVTAGWLYFAGAGLAALSEGGKLPPAAASWDIGDAMTDQWGVEVVSLRRTANGHMLDFRYRVLDPEKASSLFVRSTKPHLIHQASGKVLAVPNAGKVGPLRNSNTPKEGRTYWMFFGNTGDLVKPGDKVTVAIGDFRAEDLIVE